MKSHKPLTYNRFRAYLRYKFKNQHFSKKKLYLIIAFYLLCSLSCLFLPYNILTQYPFLKHFTDFMDFIPAIKLMESKTFAPELCKFYASYMFIIAFLCLVEIFRELLIYSVKRVMYPNSRNSHKTKIAQAVAKPIRYSLLFVAIDIVVILYVYDFFSGETIGYLRMRNKSEYFIYNLFEMLYYSLKEIGLMFVAMTIMVILSNFIFFDILKHNVLDKRRNNGRREKG